EERSVKPPDKKQSSEDSLLAYPTASNDPTVGIIFNDPPNFVDKSLTTFRHRDPAQIPTDSSDDTGNQKQKRKEEKILPGEFALAILSDTIAWSSPNQGNGSIMIQQGSLGLSVPPPRRILLNIANQDC
ncbi:hypothetical protein E4U15_006747, partial [Claviceps sp. LM218 group G6]